MVPDSVKKVPRPTNTVVVDTGSKGARRYAVRCRSGYSLTAVSYTHLTLPTIA